jgi:hypothetical protein
VAEDGSETQAATIIANKPSQIIALIPQLNIGDSYQVKIVTQYSGSRDLKDPKITVYGKTFIAE